MPKSKAVSAVVPPPSPQNLFAGTSGWAYPTWKPGFYPATISAKNFLAHYASRLNSVEVNYTFRQLPTPTQLAGWLSAVPAGFRFSFKAPQRITHFSRLVDTGAQLTAFLESLQPAAEANKLGILLFQLPPNFKASPDRLESFLASPSLKPPFRIAFEFRHDSWFTEETYTLLRQAKAALCIAEGDNLVTPEVHTAPDLACFRLRRDGGYTSAEIAAQATKLSALAASGREVYVYYRHQDEPTGALNASEFLAQASKPEAS